MKEVIKYLISKGFNYVEKDNIFIGDKCTVRILKNNYEIEFIGHNSENNTHSMFSKDLNIYWLIGVLVYYKMI